tara:strand:+ start:631 stop:1185 length:555 start_codon:yes stop_codon:yes gene_type:complete
VNKKNNISDAELSLISAISGLDNKLEELDHNISLLSKENKNVTKNLPSDPDLQKRVKDLEEKIFKLDGKNKTDLGKKYLNTLPAKGRFSSTKKGYFTADNLRLKRIESIEKSINQLHKKFDNYSFQSKNDNEVTFENDREDSDSDDIIPDEFYLRSKGIFFGFIFSIVLVFLLIIVSSGINIFI